MINEIYTEALLAAAAYADWSENSLEADRKVELINNRGFTEGQYKTLFDPASGIYEAFAYTSDLNGFSATIFKNVDETSSDFNKLTVAFRGTNPGPIDFLTDISALLGNPSGGFSALFNQNNNIDTFLDSNSLLLNGELTQPVNFAGHSLGGYLSIIAAYKYSSSFGEAYTYNGLGLNPIENGWEEMKGIFTGRSLDETKVHNYYADKGWEGASHSLLHRPGGQESIFIEHVEFDVTLENHSIEKLVQSLSVYRVLNRIDPSLSQSKLYSILDGASNVAAQSLETIIDKVGDLLGGSLATQADKDDIELFYQGVDTYVTSLGSVLTIKDVASLSGAAQLDTVEGQAYRYALVNLNTFAITGSESLYTAQANELKAENFTEQYLNDRSLLLSAINQRNKDNNQHPDEINGEVVRFKDADIGEVIAGGNSAGQGHSNTATLSKTIIFGNADENTDLITGDTNDFLYGLAGDDHILSGEIGSFKHLKIKPIEPALINCQVRPC